MILPRSSLLVVCFFVIFINRIIDIHCGLVKVADGNINSSLDKLQGKNAVTETYSDWLSTYFTNSNEASDIRTSQANFIKKYIDQSVDPCDDFYEYACGNWEKYNPIKDTKAEYNNFVIIHDTITKAVKNLLTENDDDDHEEAEMKARNLYRSCINMDNRKELGISAILETIESLGGWPILNPNWSADNYDWLNVTSHVAALGVGTYISNIVEFDLLNASSLIQYIGEMDPVFSRDLFLKNDSVLEYLTDFRVDMLRIFGVSMEDAIINAKEMLDFEYKFINISTPLTNFREHIMDIYQKMSISELMTEVPEIDWIHFFNIIQGQQVDINQEVVVMTVDYFKNLIELFSNTDTKTIANYMMLRFSTAYIEAVDERFDDALFEYKKKRYGQKQQTDAWVKCLDKVNSNIGLPVGARFIKKFFNEESKLDATLLTRTIVNEFDKLLNEADWLDEPTTVYAKEKVSAFQLNIGYPEAVLSTEKINKKYKNLEIHVDNYFKNVVNLKIFKHQEQQNKLNGAESDKLEWLMNPYSVNAYYKLNANQIVVPAGILQPPFYHKSFPQALKYAGIGFFIGHEATHAFDTTGSMFDLAGNMRNWWSEESTKAFEDRVECMVSQYSNYTISGLSLDGNKTQGENIADNGGIRAAYHAYLKWLDLNKDTENITNEALPGLDYTEKQLFFLYAAQMWCGTTRPEGMKTRISTLLHTPGKYRAIGSISNFEEFSKEFNCPIGSGMNPEKRCKIW